MPGGNEFGRPSDAPAKKQQRKSADQAQKIAEERAAEQQKERAKEAKRISEQKATEHRRRSGRQPEGNTGQKSRDDRAVRRQTDSARDKKPSPGEIPRRPKNESLRGKSEVREEGQGSRATQHPEERRRNSDRAADWSKTWDAKEIARARQQLTKSPLFRKLNELAPDVRIEARSPKEDYESNVKSIRHRIEAETEHARAQRGGKPLTRSEQERIEQQAYSGEFKHTKFDVETGKLRLRTPEEYGMGGAKGWAGAEDRIIVYSKRTNETVEDLTRLLAHEFAHKFDPVPSPRGVEEILREHQKYIDGFEYNRREIFAELLGQMILSNAKGMKSFRPTQLVYGSEQQVIRLGSNVREAIHAIYADQRLSPRQIVNQINALVQKSIVKPEITTIDQLIKKLGL